MSDTRTLAFYDASAAKYAETLSKDHVRPELADFMARIVPGGRVLDLGCGPGKASATMARAGFDPDPVDASDGMVTFAKETFGVPARQGTFETDFGTDRYDGVWASYCLLHARREDIPKIITRLARALRPGGSLFIGMKLGEGEARDSLDRFYTYVSETELHGWIAAAGLTLTSSKTGVTKGMAGTMDPCIDLIAGKPDHG